MRKRIIIIITILVWGGFFYAAYNHFSAKFNEEAIEIDNQRLFDISVNDYHIAKYYIEHERLPNNLTEVVENANADPESENIIPPAIKDPETQKDYAYKAVSEDSYQICTTFSTDTVANKNLVDDYTAYITAQLAHYAKSIYHKSGFDCMELSMAGNPEVATSKPKSTTQPEAFTFVQPKNGDKVCLGSDYTLTWKGDPTTEQVGIYLVPPVDKKLPQAWLQNGYTISPGEIVPTEQNDAKKLEGSFDWKVGTLETYVGSTAPQTVPPGTGYMLGVVTSNEGIQHTYSSDYFEIADCNVAIAR